MLLRVLKNNPLFVAKEWELLKMLLDPSGSYQWLCTVNEGFFLLGTERWEQYVLLAMLLEMLEIHRRIHPR